MSLRTFLRRFRDATGCPPGEWLLSRRLDPARKLLEALDATPVEEVARLCGFGSAAILRHHFRRRFGLGPAAYRARFAGNG